MPRIIITPPDFSGAALAALKEWLAITTAREDALLLRLLASAHETCERFTGLMPLVCGVEEVLVPAGGWLALATRPVRAVGTVAWLAAGGEATPLDGAAWSRAIAADGSGAILLVDPPADGRLVVSFTAGIAAGWAAIPPALGDGMVRLAAHAYRGRDGGQGLPGTSEPPAAVAALWRAWRRLRL